MGGGWYWFCFVVCFCMFGLVESDDGWEYFCIGLFGFVWEMGCCWIGLGIV